MTRDPNRIYIGLVLKSGDTRWETSMSLIQQAVSQLPGHSFVIKPGGGCDVAHARNLMLHDWHDHTDCGRLVWLDSDVIWLPDDFRRLVAWQVPYVAGLYPLKGLGCQWSFNGPGEESRLTPGLWNVAEVCTGFTSMTHDLHVRLRHAYSGMSYTIEDHAFRGETGHEICAMGPVMGRRLPEDFMLSRRVHNVGCEVNVDPTILVGHVGAVNLLEMHRRLGSFKAPTLE